MTKRSLGPYADNSYHTVEFGEGPGPRPPLCPTCFDSGVASRDPRSLRVAHCHRGEEESCRSPCPYETRCAACEAYWQRMVDEGLWEPRVGWTSKTFKEWTK